MAVEDVGNLGQLVVRRGEGLQVVDVAEEPTSVALINAEPGDLVVVEVDLRGCEIVAHGVHYALDLVVGQVEQTETLHAGDGCGN